MPIEITGIAAVAELSAAPGAAAKPSARPTAASLPQDTTSLSSRALSVPALTQQALSSAGARTAHVEALRQAVAAGAYNVDPKGIAEALLSSSV